ncbi:MAG: carbohydrate binding family 9 domain-containing protein [Armatimonadetes bacterium]|nr:carbohydrate binding family 9 domain-containing protein [Armatimonadota bacterium]
MPQPNLRIALVILAAFLSTAARAQGPTLPAVLVPEPPALDGDLSDACWKLAPSVTDFYATTDGSPASEQTTAWLCYDRENIYAAFHCRDSRPGEIVAQQKKRGGDVDGDDWVAFTLDCYRNYVGSVWFKVTPAGVQVESLPNRGEVSKIEWKGDWSAAAKMVDDGYIVEMAVPFSILNYDPSRTSMGVSLNRRHARSRLQWRSPDCSPDLDPRKFYVWDGLQLPKPKIRPMAMAYALIGAGDGEDVAEVGLDVKHSVSPTMTGVLTLNPDFRNVEQQVDSVDFTYTERYLSDSRPFFQEGGDYFPDSEIFYSRRIDEIDLGAKMSGMIGNYALGFLHARDFGSDDHSVLQLLHRWPAKGYVGVSGVRSGVSGVERLSGAAFGQYRLYDRNDTKINLDAEYFSADTALGSGSASKRRFQLSSYGPPRKLEWGLGHSSIDGDFDPYLGYVPEKGIRSWNGYVGIGDEPSSGRIHDWGADLSFQTADNEDGSLYQEAVSLSADLEWVNGREASVGWMESHRPPYRDRNIGFGFGWNATDLYRSGGVEVNLGRMAGGDYLSYEVWQGWNAGDKLSVQASYEYSRIRPPSPEAFSASQLIAGLSYDLTEERTVGGRLIAEDGETNLYLTFKQRVRSGTDIWLIFGDPNADKTRSTVLLKVIRLL